jgi:transcription elongation factor Elf1
MPGAVADAGFRGQALAASSRVAPFDDSSRAPDPRLYCPLCGARDLQITHVDDNLRVVRVLCASCQEHSWLAVPPIR